MMQVSEKSEAVNKKHTEHFEYFSFRLHQISQRVLSEFLIKFYLYLSTPKQWCVEDLWHQDSSLFHCNIKAFISVSWWYWLMDKCGILSIVLAFSSVILDKHPCWWVLDETSHCQITAMSDIKAPEWALTSKTIKCIRDVTRCHLRSSTALKRKENIGTAALGLEPG